MSCIKEVADTYKQVRAEKGLAEELDYSFDYTKAFNKTDPVDSIGDPSDSTWDLQGTGGVLGTITISGNIATAWISGGGKIGNTLRLTNTVVTAGGRTHVRLLILKIINRYAQIPEE